ncbi:MAG: hypothetical protein N3B11_01135 [Coriobacteriia bacterium]|nr:hypothetical protein [Coriobacteriia bacterium]
MQPCVIIPTFWTRRRPRSSDDGPFRYDHPTPVDEDGTLPECLRSLEAVEGLGRVVLIVAATHASVEHEAEDRVREIMADFPGLDALVVGPAEMGSLHRRLEQLEFADVLDGVTLGSYGAVRNVGLMVAATLGCDVAVFVDDDQVVTDPAFLSRAMEGIGEQTGKGRIVLAKSGYYTDEQGRYQFAGDAPWYDMFWRQDDAFTEALAAVGRPPRITPSTVAMGGCLAIHRDLYCTVPFDPWVARGEDIDYVINVRMHGGDVFLDGEWSVIHQPPRVPSEAEAFRQDVFRFVYEHRKLEFSKSQVDLRQVTPSSLMPYPGPFVEGSVVWRARLTALFRALAGKEPGAYLDVARRGVRRANEYARDHCERYFSFQRRWPMLMDRLWEDIPLKTLFTGERRIDRSAITGRFPVVPSER